MKRDFKCGGGVSVLGLGRSGMAAVEYFVKKGATVYAFDDAQREMLGDRCERLRALGVPLLSSAEELRGDLVFRSPAIRPDTPRLCRARLRGATVTGEAEYFAYLCPAPVFAVTGSDGKTTTSSYLAALLASTGRRVYLGGNIGRSLLPFLDEITENDLCVLELSSFQLMDFEASVFAGVVTNLSPNHLNWHKDMTEYAQAKARLLSSATHRVINKAAFPDAEGVRFSADGEADYTVRGGVLFGRGVPLCRESDVFLPGRHNIENLLAASAAAEGYIAPHAVREVARRFSGAPHRLEPLGERRGVFFYNSSIDTTPSRTAASLAALRGRHKRIFLLLGGRTKGVPLSSLLDAVSESGARPYLFGEARDEIARALDGGGISYTAAASMETAARLAFADAERGDAVLLSPACTSFDAYADFEARGEAFRYVVKNIM